MSKPRLIKDYEKVPDDIKEQIKISYPHGYHKQLIEFTNKDGNRVSALPFETDEVYYLIRMTVEEAKSIVRDDDDFDDEGNLKDDIQDEYEDKYSDVEYLDIPEEELADEEYTEEEDED